MDHTPYYCYTMPATYTEFLQRREAECVLEMGERQKAMEARAARVESGVDRAAAGLESVERLLNCGLMTVTAQLEAQAKLLSSQLARLESVDEALRNPDAVRAKEWYVKAEDLLAKGLFDMALEAFEKSQELFAANYLAHLNIGKLRLFGLNEDCDVVDLPEAIAHLSLAARIAKAEARSSAGFAPACAECYFLLSFARSVSAAESRLAGEEEGALRSCGQALEDIERALEYSPGDAGSRYQRCKLLAALRRDEEAEAAITELAKEQPLLLETMRRDGDFARLGTFLDGPELARAVEEAERARLEAKAERLEKERMKKAMEISRARLPALIEGILRDAIEGSSSMEILGEAKGLDYLGKVRLSERFQRSGKGKVLRAQINDKNQRIRNVYFLESSLEKTPEGLYLNGGISPGIPQRIPLGSAFSIQEIQIHDVAILELIGCLESVDSASFPEMYRALGEAIEAGGDRRIKITYIDIANKKLAVKAITPLAIVPGDDGILLRFADSGGGEPRSIDAASIVKIEGASNSE